MIANRVRELVGQINEGTRYYLKRIIVGALRDKMLSSDVVQKIRAGLDINAFLENKENRDQDFKELFFAHTSKIFEIDYQGANAIEVYNILNFDNKRKIDDSIIRRENGKPYFCLHI